MPTGVWIAPPASPRWWFDSGALSLDFAHTTELESPAAIEALENPSDLTGWITERFGELGDDAQPRDLVDALALRSAILRLARAAAARSAFSADDVDSLNLYAATPDVPPALAGGTRQAGRTRVRVGQALATIARDAVKLLCDSEARIRECTADDCSLVFYDESRTNNRRWCSMQRCGNRAKVTAFRARSSR